MMYINDNYLKTQKHLAQLRHQISGVNASTQYEYIIGRNDLQDAFLRGMADLGYPLRKEVKRDRYVLNAEAFEKALEKATTDTLNQMEKEIYVWINTEVKGMIEDTTEEVLNSIVVQNNEFVAKSRGKAPKKHWAEKLGEKFGKALAKGILNALEEITSGNPRR